MTNHNYQLSDDFIVWLESLVGLLTTVKSVHGGIIEMIESPKWDDGKTEYAANLVHDLRVHLENIEREIADHVKEKPL